LFAGAGRVSASVTYTKIPHQDSALTHLPRVALEIKTVGLYDLVLQDVQKIAGKM